MTKGSPLSAGRSFVDQAQIAIERYDGKNLMELAFVGCFIEGCDIRNLNRQLLQKKTTVPLHISLDHCRLRSSKTLQTFRAFLKSHQVHSLGFFWFDDPDIARGLVSACADRLLNMDITFLCSQPGALGLLLEPCTQLQHLKLNVQFSSTEVRWDNIQELVTALVSSHSLQTLDWSQLELDDTCFAALVGGLLALKGTLEKCRIQATGLSQLSLPLLPHLLTELPHLQSLDLELDQSPTFLLDETPSEDEALQNFCRAIQVCPCQSLHLTWLHVGWTEETILQVLKAAVASQIPCEHSFFIEEVNLVRNERFVDELAKLLPRMTSVKNLSIIDSRFEPSLQSEDQQHIETDGVEDWWTKEKQIFFVQALYNNWSLRTFDLRISHLQTDFQSVMKDMLQRTSNNRIYPQQHLVEDETPVPIKHKSGFGGLLHRHKTKSIEAQQQQQPDDIAVDDSSTSLCDPSVRLCGSSPDVRNSTPDLHRRRKHFYLHEREFHPEDVDRVYTLLHHRGQQHEDTEIVYSLVV